LSFRVLKETRHGRGRPHLFADPGRSRPHPHAGQWHPARPQGADQYDFDGDDNPQEDGGDPAGAAQTGGDHTRRPERTEAMRGQGPKTRAAQKSEINREPGFGPKGG
jgi:hypothetical protein